MTIWNPWHGCHKISPGCANCYVYRRDESIGKDASVVAKTGDYTLPVKKNRQGEYKLRPEDGTVFTCMTSDFFLEEADAWRRGCWDMIRERQDLAFYIITKRIDRFLQCIPPDWGDGWAHVTICSTCENQDRTDHRLPILLALPIRHREVISEPILGEIHMEDYLATGLIEHVTCGGESGPNARPCDFRWIQEIRRECIRSGVPFTFKQTGAVFIRDGKTYRLDRKDQIPQARKSGYSYIPGAGSADAIQYRLPERSSLFERLRGSAFRSRFHLSEKDREYIAEKGRETIRRHAEAFIEQRLAAENPENDGKQTPMKGHPVFIAQHATACCCRSCLEKWHHIPAGKTLTKEEQSYIADVIMDWMTKNGTADRTCRENDWEEPYMLFVIACIASFIPYTALFLWLRGRRRDDPAYRKLCGRALGHGVMCLLPVILFSGVSYFIVRLTGLHQSNPLLYQAVYTVIVLALMEELAKYLLFRRVVNKTPYPCSWLDKTILMTIVGIGFGAIEAVIYSIGASIPVVLVRGICLPHAGYGFIVGYFCGKSEKYGKPVYKWIGFLIAWLLHGIYDFSLSEEFLAINDNLAIVAVLLALLDILLVIRLIVFVNKAKKNEIYNEV